MKLFKELGKINIFFFGMDNELLGSILKFRFLEVNLTSMDIKNILL